MIIKIVIASVALAIIISTTTFGAENTTIVSSNSLPVNATQLAAITTSIPSIPSDSTPASNQNMSQDKHHCAWKMHKMMRVHSNNGFMLPLWDLGLMNNKNLTSDEAKTITQAALLMYNRKDLHVGTITSQLWRDRDFYIIQILDNSNKLVSTIVMDRDTGIIRPYSQRMQKMMGQQTPGATSK